MLAKVQIIWQECKPKTLFLAIYKIAPPHIFLVRVVQMCRYHKKFPQPNLLSKVVRLGLDMKIARMGSTLAYIPFWLLIERPSMTSFHKRLHVDGATKCILRRLHNCFVH